MSLFSYILIAAFLESAISFSGVFLVLWSEEKIKKFLHTILSFAVGALLGVAFLDILPEAIETGTSAKLIFSITLGSIIFFFFLEKLLLWYHHHEEGSLPHEHSPAYLVLVGDLIHNFIDGVAIALSFMASIPLGIAATIAILIHEVPTEIGDFLVLLNGGFSRAKALWYNFFVSLSTIVGAVITYFLGDFLSAIIAIPLAFVAGNFIYIAIADLMPELHEHTNWKHAVAQTTLLILGILLVHIGVFFEP